MQNFQISNALFAELSCIDMCFATFATSGTSGTSGTNLIMAINLKEKVSVNKKLWYSVVHVCRTQFPNQILLLYEIYAAF